MLPDGWPKRMAPVWSLLAVCWFSLTLLWASDGMWVNAAINLVIGSFCWIVSERLRR